MCTRVIMFYRDAHAVGRELHRYHEECMNGLHYIILTFFNIWRDVA